MEEIGKVIGISGKLVEVEIEPKGSCSHCISKAFCNPRGNKMHMEAINEQNTRIGDRVKININPRVTTLVTFLIFILPISSFGIGFTIFSLIAKTHNLGILGGIGFMIVYFLFLKKLNDRVSKIRKFMPIVTETL